MKIHQSALVGKSRKTLHLRRTTRHVTYYVEYIGRRRKSPSTLQHDNFDDTHVFAIFLLAFTPPPPCQQPPSQFLPAKRSEEPRGLVDQRQNFCTQETLSSPPRLATGDRMPLSRDTQHAVTEINITTAGHNANKTELKSRALAGRSPEDSV